MTLNLLLKWISHAYKRSALAILSWCACSSTYQLSVRCMQPVLRLSAANCHVGRENSFQPWGLPYLKVDG